MNLTVPTMLFGWVPLTIILFLILKPRRAVICSVFGGFLFLPLASYDWPGLPAFSKTSALALSLLLGGIVSGQRKNASFRWQIHDLPMVVWCFFSPLFSSHLNGLGFYDGLSGVVNTYLTWGVFYWAGRIYFTEISDLRDLSVGIIIGGLIYVPLCLFELRMSPKLSYMFYGFFPHIYSQHVRYGGYRPIVFMQHGLMVALWMAQASVVTYWFWRNRIIQEIKILPIQLLAFILFVTAILCKSVNGWFFLLAGIISCIYFKTSKSSKLFWWIILLIPIYIVSRITGIISAEIMQEFAQLIFINDERIQSLTARLVQEDLFSVRSMERPFFGWGLLLRGLPIDPDTGKQLVSTWDALWTIILSTRGLVGLTSLYLSMLLGPWLVFRNDKHLMASSYGQYEKYRIDALVISLVVFFFVIDSLMNAMFSPVYILCSGALVSSHLSIKKELSAE